LRQYRTAINYPPPQAHADINLDNVDIEAEAATPPAESELLRIHFVHHRSSSATAIPLLYCHTWPGSFLEISRCLDALVNPVETPTQQTGGGVWREKVAFHVVAPSLPGYGFSDASSRSDFGIKDTAGVMVELMRKLGYERFVVWGDSW
jgi:pimeloyl-ACP methyl ester carboxylesterase